MNYLRRLVLRSAVIIILFSIAFNLFLAQWESSVWAGDTGWKSIFDGKSSQWLEGA